VFVVRVMLASSFYCAGRHRALHSFPTRRSSDLEGAQVAQREALEPGAQARDARDPDLAIARHAHGDDDAGHQQPQDAGRGPGAADRKSTRLNSSHVKISYAVFCLKKKTTTSLST